MTIPYLEFLISTFPTILLSYYIIKAYSSKLFLLGIPFLMYMQHSVMFHYHFTHIFDMPRSVSVEFRLFFWLFIVWLFSVKYSVIAKHKAYRKLSIGEYLISIIILFTILHIMYGLYHSVSIDNVFSNALPILYLTIGYLFIKQILISYSDRLIQNFVTSIVVITAITQHLYILNQGFGLPLYPYEAYTVISYLGSTFTRSFSFINPLTFFVLGFSLANIENNKKYFYLLMIYFISTLLSYTRGAIIGFIVIIMLYIIVSSIKHKWRIRYLYKYVVLALVIYGSVMLWTYLFPVRSSFFMKRMDQVIDAYSETNEFENITTVENVAGRQKQFSNIFENMNSYQKLFGLGFSEETSGNNELLLTGVVDLEWEAELKYFGVTGIVIFTLLQVYYILLGLILYFTRNDNASRYGLACSLTIAAGLISTFNSVTFLYKGFAMVFWTFALLQVTNNRVTLQSRVFPKKR